MRFIYSFMALLASLLAVPAQAATIIQNVSLVIATSIPFEGFDSSLGTLNSVTYSVNVTSNRLAYIIGVLPPSFPAETPVDWQINGSVKFTLPSGIVDVAVKGSGSSISHTAVGQDRGVPMSATGSGTFNLDPTNFVDLANASQPYHPGGFFFNFKSDPGLYNYKLDTTLSSPLDLQSAGLSLIGLDGECDNNQHGTDDCIVGRATLTYNYTPVPEPQTWALMLVGFGIVGSGMRSRKARSVLA